MNVFINEKRSMVELGTGTNEKYSTNAIKTRVTTDLDICLE